MKRHNKDVQKAANKLVKSKRVKIGFVTNGEMESNTVRYILIHVFKMSRCQYFKFLKDNFTDGMDIYGFAFLFSISLLEN